jgi:diketogulonate reductase-like aldo/keto reductase
MRKRSRIDDKELPTGKPPMVVHVAKLRRGGFIPLIGFGTFRCKGSTCTNAVQHALLEGVRLIDTAESYNNEKAVGEGIKASRVDRREIFICTKIGRDSMKNPSSVRSAVHQSLKELGTTYLDMVLIHWPGTSNSNPQSRLHSEARKAAWETLCELASCVIDQEAEGVEKYMIRHIGVSNFNRNHLEELLDLCKEKSLLLPEVNQIECHPFCRCEELRHFMKERDIAVQAYCSLGRCLQPPKMLYGKREPDHPRLVKNDELASICSKVSLSESQVLLRWALQQGISVIPMSTDPEHISQNYWKLDDDSTYLPQEVLAQLSTMIIPVDPNSSPGEVRYAYDARKFPV